MIRRLVSRRVGLAVAAVLAAGIAWALYACLPWGMPEAGRYFDPIGERNLQADERGQLRALMEEYFLLSVTGDDFKGWDTSRRDFWKYAIAFSSYGIPSAMIIDPENFEDYKVLMDSMIWKMKSKRVWDDFTDRGFGSDPISHQNIMYKGHLNLMFGLYQLSTGDLRYAREYTWLTRQIAEEMRLHHQGHYEGVTCEPNAWFVECNTIGILSLHIYDKLFGTHYTENEVRWLLDFIMERMRDRQTRLFYRLYLPHHDIVQKRIDGYTNGWVLTFLRPFLPEEMKNSYDSFKLHLVQSFGPYAAVAGQLGARPNPTAHIFGLWAAKEFGDVELFGKLRNSIDKFGGLHSDPDTLGVLYDHPDNKLLNGVVLATKLHLGWDVILNHDWDHEALPYQIPDTTGMQWTDLLPSRVYSMTENGPLPGNSPDRPCPNCFWGDYGPDHSRGIVNSGKSCPADLSIGCGLTD